MTSVKIDEYFVKEFRTMKDLISDFNIYACREIARDIAKISAMFDLPVGVFIGDFLKNVFSDLEELEEYGIEDKDKKEVISKLFNFIDLLTDNPQILVKRTIDNLNLIERMTYR